MTRFLVCLSVTLAVSSGVTAAAANKADKKAAAAKANAADKDKGSAAADKAKPATGPAAEMDKLKGDYKWGMTSEEVIAKVQDVVRATFEERLKKAQNDPTRQDRVRKEMTAEVERVKGRVIKFDGTKSGYDVSIVDQEFLHNSGESMLIAKEENATRYFFLADDRLYKMFLAFDKEMLQGKSFREFGQLMQARFGKAREVTVEERTKAGVKTKLDHFVWGNKNAGDMLRLVDRSEFYDVFCLVIYDAKVAAKQDDLRKARMSGPRRDNLVESVTTQSGNDRDPNDNVLDQITGKQVYKPGERPAEAIVVPSPVPAVRAPTPAEINRRDPQEATEKPAAEKKGRKSGKSDATKGLDL